MGGVRGPAAVAMSQGLGDFVTRGRGAELLLQIFAHVEEVGIRVIEIFFSVDTDGSGELDVMEFEDALKRMGVHLAVADVSLAFEELDADASGDIAIEEFMGRMRSEKKWRERANMKKSSKEDSADQVTMLALLADSAEERVKIIEQASQDIWDKSALKALRLWGDKVNEWEGMDDDEKLWRQQEMQAAKADMMAEREEAEAAEAEANYDKEELEALVRNARHSLAPPGPAACCTPSAPLDSLSLCRTIWPEDLSPPAAPAPGLPAAGSAVTRPSRGSSALLTNTHCAGGRGRLQEGTGRGRASHRGC